MRLVRIAAFAGTTMALLLGGAPSASAAEPRFYANGGGKYVWDNTGVGGDAGVAEFGFANTAEQAFGIFAQDPSGYLVINGDITNGGSFQIQGDPDCLLAEGGRGRPPAVAGVQGTITRVTGTVPLSLRAFAEVGKRYALLNIFDRGEPSPSDPDPDSFIFSLGEGGMGCGNHIGGSIEGLVVRGNVVVEGL
jgi:hypothetical protein